jgi:hypothetical protein
MKDNNYIDDGVYDWNPSPHASHPKEITLIISTG